MCEYIKTKFPHIYLYTSTNGLALNEEKARRLVHSGIDEVTFSIDGASQDTYVQYRQRGDFDMALANLRAMADEKAAARPRRAAPELALHPLQVERQRRGDGRGAAAGGRDRRRSPLLGDHRSPRGQLLAALRARAPTTTRPSRTRSGTTTTWATPSPARRRARRSTCTTLVPGLPILGRGAAGRCSLQTRVTNLSNRRFAAQASYGRRLVRLGAQLCAADGTLINRDYARAWLPAPSRGRPAGRRRDRDSRARRARALRS